MKELRSLNRFFWKYKLKLLAGAFFVVAANLFNIFPAQLTRSAIDFVFENKASYDEIATGVIAKSTFYSSIIKQIAWFGILILLAVLARGVFMFFMRQSIIVMSRHIEFDMKNEIYNHYQNSDASFFTVNSTGDLLNRLSEDVSRVRMYTGPAIMYLINIVFMFIIVVIAMFRINVQLTWIVLLPLPLLVIMVYYVQQIINRKGETVQQQLSTIATGVQETFSGIRIVKSFAKENQFLNAFRQKVKEYKNQSMQLARVNALFYPAIVLLVGLSTISTIYFGGKYVIEGKISYGNIAEFIIYINLLTWPIGMLGWVVTLIQRAAASQKRINEFLDIKPTIKSLVVAHQSKLNGEIVFDNISFRYANSGVDTVKNISLHISKGERIAIVGDTGSGKTTFANLCLRLMDPTAGQIKFDGISLKEWDLGSLREQVGYVAQDVVLFSDTIFNNIAFGLTGENFKHDITKIVEQAAEISAVHTEILSFKNSYLTEIGERGVTLSGGQKQRVSIARALIKEPSLLIFDDSFSSLDTQTEEKILTQINKKFNNQTIIILGHRLSTIKYVTRIFVLHGGKIVEEGSHQQLLTLNGYYSAMHKAQLAGNKFYVADQHQGV